MTTSNIPLFPLSRALYPDGILHLRIFEVRYLDMIKNSIEAGEQFGIVPLLEGSEVRTPTGKEVLANAGTLARIDKWDSPMAGLINLRCTGTASFRLQASNQARYGLWNGQVELIEPDPVAPIPDALRASANRLGKLIADMQKDGTPTEAMPMCPPFRLDECGWVANRWCELLMLPPLKQQEMLLNRDPMQRLENVQKILTELHLI